MHKPHFSECYPSKNHNEIDQEIKYISLIELSQGLQALLLEIDTSAQFNQVKTRLDKLN